jgi:carbon-monoxide dehydrogenase small subunit
MVNIIGRRSLKRIIALLVNDETYEVAVEPQTTLLEALRDHLGLTGTKEACGTGECGSCTVLVEGKPILSCLALAVDHENQRILTIEGLSEGEQLTPVQQAFVEQGAIQCGFCTPGVVLSTTALLNENSRPTGEQIRKALEGHLCRCTGYNKIFDAVNMAAKSIDAKSS